MTNKRKNEPLTLKQLVKIVPLDKKTKELVLKKGDSLSPEQKYQIAKICWRLLAAVFLNQLKSKEEKMFWEMARGISNYDKKDFQRVEDEVIADFLIKMDEVKTEEKVKAIKNQLNQAVN